MLTTLKKLLLIAPILYWGCADELGDARSRSHVGQGPNGWPGGASWELEAILSIGDVDGDPHTTFGRVADSRLGPDTLLYVLDAHAREVRVFDLSGNHRRTVGGPGRGPGEFLAPYALAVGQSGELWVADAATRRYTVFDFTDNLVRTHANPFQRGLNGKLRLSGGRLVDSGVIAVMESGPDGGLAVRASGLLTLSFAVADSFRAVDTLALPVWRPSGLTRSSGLETVTVFPPFSPQQHQEPADSGTVWVGRGDTYVIHKVTMAGDTVGTASRSVEAQSFSHEDELRLEAWRDSVVGRGDGLPDDLVPKTYPLFERISVADDGHLWVLRRMTTGTQEADVFDPQGRFLGTLHLPFVLGANGVPFQIAGGHLVGVTEDSLGVQSVAVLRLHR